LNNKISACPNLEREPEKSENAAAELLGESVLRPPETNPTFPPSNALGLEDVSAIMGGRYGSIVGILGAPDAGKTACIVSIYLMLANNKLTGYEFADSRSLLAFEEIARGARRWTDDGTDDQMTTHTEVGDGRSAGLLHLRVKRLFDNEKFDLFIPDLPGEWSNNFVDSNVHERLAFLKAADAIWLMVDGRSLTDATQRLNTVHRFGLLIDRLAFFLGAARPTLFLVSTRLDLASPSPELLAPLNERAARHGFALEVRTIASFSRRARVKAGAGISELIDQTLKVATTTEQAFWPSARGHRSARLALQYPEDGSE
jgi:hypothetical protein